MTTQRRSSWLDGEAALSRILSRQLGAAWEKAKPRVQRMGEQAANEGSTWAAQADRNPPKLVTHDRSGERIDEIDYHHSYRQLQQLGYGGGIVAASYDPALAPERGDAPKSLTFGLGYLFGQAEAGMYCPVCMTDGAAYLLQKFGTSELKERFLTRLGTSDMNRVFTGAMFLTEKQGGSDVGQITTTAKGGQGVPGEAVKLYGDKWFCSNVDADVIMILARPEGATAGTRGLGLYVLPRHLENGQRNAYRVNRIKDKLGERSFPSGEVTLEGATAYLLGGPGEGFQQMTVMLNLSRLYNAIASVAVMRRAVVESIAWAEERVAFGKKVIEHPLMAETLMDMASEQRLALNWAFRGVSLMDRLESGKATEEERRTLRMLTPLLKYVLGKLAVSLASEGVEALGGNGYIEDWPLARVLRDAQVLPIWEGTTNILVLDTFRALRKESGHEALFSELERGISESPGDLQPRLGQMFEELKTALTELVSDATGEHAWRDWTDRASFLWNVTTSFSKSLGYGTATDERAARRVFSKYARSTLLRKDRATAADVRAIAFT
ncbi:MAG: acyl-CoA dehydrogenase family protein [Archangium sp.]|nr:acyl-CoA dehydrogenase family protein [Archangium sp.]MDP3151329.1 acyl-CoA dehydrogenase family protein [Archangium sp.]MDP3571614.1 acyl-CoA dehydrogenase family protein [Archangium sp.]